MSTETIARRLSSDGAALRGISADCLKLADTAGDAREALRKIGGGGLAKALGSLDRIVATCRNVPVRLVTASRGKAVRAEPISVRYHRGEVHHVDRFEKLEDQLLGFTTGGFEGAGSPDHADAAIWALRHLLGGGGTDGIIAYYERIAAEQASPPSMIRCQVPRPGTFYLISGRPVLVGEDLVADLTAAEAKPMHAAGWTVPGLPQEGNQ